MVKNGEKENPPIQVPNIAGTPAIIPNPIIFPTKDFVLARGAAIARPSVVL